MSSLPSFGDSALTPWKRISAKQFHLQYIGRVSGERDMSQPLLYNGALASLFFSVFQVSFRFHQLGNQCSSVSSKPRAKYSTHRRLLFLIQPHPQLKSGSRLKIISAHCSWIIALTSLNVKSGAGWWWWWEKNTSYNHIILLDFVSLRSGTLRTRRRHL